MAKVLVIRKPDGTQRGVPIYNKAVLLAENNRLPEGQKWEISEMDEAEAANLPFINPDFVPPAVAKEKAKQLVAQLSERDELIAQLQKQLEEKIAAATGSAKPESAEQLIEQIHAATTADEVKQLLGTDQRKTVTDAANKKLLSFN